MIKEIVILANNEDEYLNGLLAVMIWGYSGNSVGSLGTGRDYIVSVVVRDLATGQENVIKGEGITK